VTPRVAPRWVLHVVGGMNPGGIESWLMQVLRRSDPAQVRMDFAVDHDSVYAYEPEIRARGARLIRCLHPERPWTYARNFRRLLAAYGPYDVVHSHVDHYSGYVLRLAQAAGVPVRIAHSHLSGHTASVSGLRRLYLAGMKHEIARYATRGLAASPEAAVALFGPAWAANPHRQVLPCAIDLAPFAVPADGTVRAELGIPADAFVLGHVGRFVPQKNHAFLLALSAVIARRLPAFRLLLIGDGPLRPALEAQAAALGLTGQVIFAGPRTDVARVLRGAVDVFAFPSLFEGLGLALVEAQAAGCPCVVADTVPAMADLVPALLTRLGLDQPAEQWAAAVLAAGHAAAPDAAAAYRRVQASPFNLEVSLYHLLACYASPQETAHV
jgi:glycosyltransferase involved in cell wall biosynthesis